VTPTTLHRVPYKLSCYDYNNNYYYILLSIYRPHGVSFTVSGPVSWNSLPQSLHNRSFLPQQLRRLLKTFLFTWHMSSHYHESASHKTGTLLIHNLNSTETKQKQKTTTMQNNVLNHEILRERISCNKVETRQANSNT